MPTEGIHGLPSRPLTESDLHSLDRHSAIAFCHPIYQLEAKADAIIAVYLGINDRIYVLIYNRDEEQWERVDTVTAPSSLTEASELDSQAAQTRVDAYYEETEVEPAGYPQEPMEALAGNLPQEPLSDSQLAAIRDRGFVVEVIPFVRRAGDERFITLFLVFEDPLEPQRIVGSYGYEPTNDEWRLLNTVEGSTADEEREPAFDVLADDTVEWLLDTYSRDEFTLAEDAVDELSS